MLRSENLRSIARIVNELCSPVHRFLNNWPIFLIAHVKNPQCSPL